MTRLVGCLIAIVIPAVAVAAPQQSTVPAVDPLESIVSEYQPQAAPVPNPPPYTLLRHTERYDYLADPNNRSDLFDPIKYVSLSERDPRRFLSLGGEVRERYDVFRNVGFGLGPEPHDDSYWTQRVSLHADLHIDRVRVFAQGISAIERGEERTAAATNEDPIDLQQGFADYLFGDATTTGPRLTTRVGRFEMSFGSSRLVATRAGPNVPNRFDGLQLVGASQDARLYAFVTHPVIEDKHRFDSSNGSQSFWGAYAVVPAGEHRLSSFDLYYLGLRVDEADYAAGSAPELRHSLGARVWGARNGWSYDWEPVVQFGHFGERDILAWTLATDTGYTFALPVRPRLGLKADIASGDSGNAGGRFGTFNPLFFKAGYFNDAALIRPANIADLHPSFQISSSPKVTATIASDVIWRHRISDALYAVSGKELLPAGGTSRYVGTTAEAALQWKANRHVVVNGAYAHLFAGNAVSAIGGSDIDYFGSWVTVTW
jgi:hypothetical protein